MTTAKCAGIFLQCLLWLMISVFITASSISFGTNGRIVFDFNINKFFASDLMAKNIAKQQKN